MKPTDEALLVRWQQGDQSAGKALVERYYDAVARFFRNKINGDVADLIQDTFAKLVGGHHRVRDRSRFRAFLFSIAYHVLNDHLRGQYRDRPNLDFQELSVADLAPGPGTVAWRNQEERLLLEALRNVPIDYQVLLELRYWEELKTADIGVVLDIPHGTVRSRLHRAHDLLRQAMERLAQSAEQLESTMARLSDWARACRARVDGVSA